MNIDTYNRFSLIIFAILKILEAVREVLVESKGKDDKLVQSLDETSTKLVALASEVQLKRVPS